MFPLYIWMMSSLLFISFLYFTFAQAAVRRSDGQYAADAAALAEAQAFRDQLYSDFLDVLDGSDEGDLRDILDGDTYEPGENCGEAAARLAAENEARVTRCVANDGRMSYTVEVETLEPVGESLIPGTENQVASAQATAVIVGRCDATEEEEDRIELACDEEDWDFDPDDEDGRPDARDLYQVYLED